MAAQTECKRCGTCCQKGGPALHTTDIGLIKSGIIPLETLVTVRKNEPAYRPDLNKVVPAENEFIKLAGKKRSWECFFYEAENASCRLHPEHPVECRLLQCWNTVDVEGIIGKDCLTRLDIIQGKSPIINYIQKHETACSYSVIHILVNQLQTRKNVNEAQSKLSEMIKSDMKIRDEAVRAFNLSLGMELFYFGRPLFQVFDVERLLHTGAG